jgi:hypothetical protein
LGSTKSTFSLNIDSSWLGLCRGAPGWKRKDEERQIDQAGKTLRDLHSGGEVEPHLAEGAEEGEVNRRNKRQRDVVMEWEGQTEEQV